jgi:hypothetical protein
VVWQASKYPWSTPVAQSLLPILEDILLLVAVWFCTMFHFLSASAESVASNLYRCLSKSNFVRLFCFSTLS